MSETPRGERSAALQDGLPDAAQEISQEPGRAAEAAPGTVRRFLLFSVAGVLSAAAHYSLMAVLIMCAGMAPVLSSSLGVVLATVVAFLANHHVTFADADGNWRVNGPRWMLVAGGVWVTNGVVLKLLLVLGVGLLVAQTSASLLSFLFSFVVNRRFTFRL